MARLRKPMIRMLIFLAVIFGIVIGVHTLRNLKISQFVSQFQRQPITISTTQVKTQAWHTKLSAIGTLVAVNGVDLSTEVAGQVMKIDFESGVMVEKGELLLELDHEIDDQNLKTNQAQLNLDKANYERQVELFKTRATSQNSVDQAQAKYMQSQAAQATAEVYINKKMIKAPFAGKVGIRQVSLGQYVTPGQPLVTLQALDPLYVDFALPEQDLPFIHVNQEIQMKADSAPNKTFSGTIQSINSKVDVETRTINVRGIVQNQNLELFPGVFADINIVLPVKQNVLTIPQTAVALSLQGDSVYVITSQEKDNNGKPILIAKQRFVTLGERQGNLVAVVKGLSAGEEVVTSGQLKLHPGAQVNVSNKVTLD